MTTLRLSAEQEALVPVVRDEWLAHGLRTGPADRAEAERGVRLAYEAAGLAAPSLMLWLGSPLAGAIGQAILRLPDVRGQVWDQVGDQVWGQVWGQVRDQVGDWYRAVIYGQHEAGWLSFYDYFRRAAPAITGPERLEGHNLIARNSGWWFGLEGAAILTERPTHLSRDDQDRLHDEKGPAIAYPDGFGVWCWHGQRVPQWVIESPTPEKIGNESNIEVRRCAIESYGWDRYVAGWTPIDTCPDPGNAPHTLSLYDVPRGLWGEDVRVLVCTNGTPEPDGTPRKYGLAVPAHMSRALQAAAASYRVSEAEYATLGRRS